MSELKYSKDGLVCFNAADHSYMLGDKRMTGVTTLISKFKNKFDADATAEKYGAKHGIDKEVLLKEWAEKSQYSLEHGTAVHKVFEDYAMTGEITTSGQYQKEAIAVQFILDMFETKRLVPVEAEMIIHNDAIASQIDMIAKDKHNNHYILDWKTNAKIETNGYNKTMLFPFSNFPDASFFHYSLQLNFYKRLCKDYEIKDMYIVHIAEQEYKMYRPVQMHIPDYILNDQKQATFA